MLFRSWPILEREWLIQGITFFITLFTVSKFYTSRIFFFVLFYCIVLCLNVFAGDTLYDDYVVVVLELFKYCIPAAITYYFLKTDNKKGIKVSVYLFLGLTVFTTVSSFIISLSFPGIIRLYVSHVNGHLDLSEFTPFLRLGMSNYYLPHALPVLIPALFVGVLNRSYKKSLRVFFLVAWISIVVLTYLSGATTAILFSLLFSIMVLFVRRKSLSKNLATFVVGSLIIIPLMAERQVLVRVLENLEETLVGTDYASKVVQIADIVESGEVTGGDAETRSDLYSQTLSQFVKHPIFGTDDSVGGHSALMDRMACLGLIGFIPFLLIFVFHIKFVLRYIPNDLKAFYVLGLGIAFLMLVLKYMLYFEMSVIILTILPFAILLLGSGSERISNK